MITIVHLKHIAARTKAKRARAKVIKAQALLDHEKRLYNRKIKTLKHLDVILAEVIFTLKQKTKQARRSKKQGKKQKLKTLDDIMSCLKSLPADQREKVIQTFKAKQQRRVS